MEFIRTSALLLLASFLSLTFSTLPLTAQNAELLTADQFEMKMQSLEEYQLVDVRTYSEYRIEHLLSAVNLNFNETSFSELLEGLDKGKPIFVYCKNGNRSAQAAVKMIEMGFQNVYDLQGGITAWKKARKPLSSQESKSIRDKFTSGDLKKIINSNNIVLVDFYATWCIPCMKMKPALDTLSKQFEGKVLITSINVEYAKGLSRELGIREIPVLNAYKAGKLVETYTGYLSESRLRTIIKNMLAYKVPGN